MPIDIVRSDGFDGSAKLLVGLKRFIKDDINQKALESAELLKRQIDYFQKVGSKSKIFMIVQGNCLNTVNQYANVMLKNLSDSEIEQIHGIAVSGACFGNGDLDKWNILMNLRNIDIPGTLKRNIHLLGITSYKAISPLFLFKNYWNFNDVISIDSTSYTRRYLIDGEIAPLAKIDKSKSLKEQEEFYIKIYKDIEEFIKPLGYDYQKMLDHATYYSRHNVNNIWAYIKRDEKYAQEVSSMFAIQSTCYFIQEFNEKLHALYKEEHPMFYDEIRTYNDWLKFKIHFVRTFGLKSNAVKSSSRKDFELESKIKDLW
jgi:hypothetical protein